MFYQLGTRLKVSGVSGTGLEKPPNRKHCCMVRAVSCQKGKLQGLSIAGGKRLEGEPRQFHPLATLFHLPPPSHLLHLR